MKTIPLTESRSVTLDGAGNGVVSFAPIYSERWHPKLLTIATSTAVVVPQAFVYVGDSASAQNQVDATLFGSQNASDALASYDPLPAGTKIFVKWTTGDPGATATANLRGMKDVP